MIEKQNSKKLFLFVITSCEIHANVLETIKRLALTSKAAENSSFRYLQNSRKRLKKQLNVKL